jgi:hypothetical protein
MSKNSHSVIKMLWCFWLETLVFVGLVLHSLLDSSSIQKLTTEQRIALSIYFLALFYTLFHFVKFVSHRFKS